jgi:hypothetical protein
LSAVTESLLLVELASRVGNGAKESLTGAIEEV